MSVYHDYESMWMGQAPVVNPPLLEYYSGTQVVRWWGVIERQLKDKISKYEAQRNQPYADKMRAFAKVWKEHELTGSINRETVDALKTAASVLGDDPWTEGNYFSNLTSSLQVLLASEEQLPRIDEPNEPSDGGGLGTGAPVGDFGPEKEMTPDGGNPGNPEEPEPEGGPEAEVPDEEMPDEGGQKPSVRRAVAAAVQGAQ